MEFLYEYGLFLAKSVTIVAAFVVIVGVITSAAMKQKQSKGQLEVKSLNEQLDELAQYGDQILLDKAELKKKHKEQKKAQKEKSKDDKSQPHLFVIDFKGSMDAHEVEQLRQEVTAVLCMANEDDEVLVKVESGGGVVHGYGLAASQLQRLRDKKLKITASVDKVAASGGYMMACVADTIVAAPFAIIGSIGVIAQLPNFNRLLKHNNIDFEQHTAGDFKRTLTVFGENTEQGREKFREELNAVHELFKEHVVANRTDINIDKVATGEYWYGQQAQTLQLVDELVTSDDFLLSRKDSHRMYGVKYTEHKNIAARLGIAASTMVEKAVSRTWSQAQHWFKS